jgi:signal transduction histidine kinase
MTTRCDALRRRVPTVAALALALAALGASAATPKRVMVVHSYGIDVAPFGAVASSFRATLVKDLGAPVDFDEVSLDLARFAEAPYQTALFEFLQRRLAVRPVDLVATIGAPATRFVGQHRERLCPSTPVAIVGADPRLVPVELLHNNAFFVTQPINPPGIVEDILRLKPDTTNIVILFGTSTLERFWVGEFRRELARFSDRVHFTWLTDLPLDEAVKQCRTLPPHSFIFFGIFLLDPMGLPHTNDDALPRLHEAANAPVFGYYRSDLGKGTIGGHLFADARVGALAGSAAARMLRGEPAGQIPAQILPDAAPTYDWRELRRWGVSEASLPAGSVVLFREPTFWERNWQWSTALALVFLLEAGLILGLLVNRAKLRAAEAQIRDFSRRLMRVQEDGRARLARELHDDVTQRLARLAIDVGMVESGVSSVSSADLMRTLREELVGLSEDVHSLAYRLHPSVLEDLGLGEALKAEAERLSRQKSVSTEVTLGDVPAVIPRDLALGLFRIAQEALRNVGRHASANSVEVSLSGVDGGLQLAVRDDGSGFAPDAPGGPAGLGLTSMRERVLLLEGRFEVKSAPGRGTTVSAWVPLREEST